MQFKNIYEYIGSTLNKFKFRPLNDKAANRKDLHFNKARLRNSDCVTLNLLSLGKYEMLHFRSNVRDVGLGLKDKFTSSIKLAAKNYRCPKIDFQKTIYTNRSYLLVLNKRCFYTDIFASFKAFERQK